MEDTVVFRFRNGHRVKVKRNGKTGVVVGFTDGRHVVVIDGEELSRSSSLHYYEDLESIAGLPVSQLKPGHLYTDLVSGLPVLVVDQESTPDKNKFALIKYFHNGEYKSALAVDGQLEERR